MHTSLIVKSAVAAACIAGLAMTARAEDPAGRFTMTPTEGGFVRLDKETGAMSICTGKEGEWACKPMPDGEQQLKAKIDALEAENKALKEKRSAEAEPPPATATPDSVPPVPPGNLPVPTEKDVDKLFDYVEGMMKKFKERIQRLEKEAQKEETPL